MRFDPPSPDEVMSMLRGVVDPELGADIVELGMAKGAEVSPEGAVVLKIALTTAGCPLQAQIRKDATARIGSHPGVTRVKVEWGELTPAEKAVAMERARRKMAERNPETAVPSTAKVVLVASGKGGVGKSSVTVNLAAAIASRGYTVGLIDADIWGFSVPRMLGIDGRLAGDGTKDDRRIVPHEVPVGEGRIKVVSMGFLVENEEDALMWRGLILNRAVQHFLEDVVWDGIDYLLIDMPPGTGDVQMGIAKLLPRSEMLVITTPARTAQKVAIRAVNMARKNFLRVAGVIENMSAFVAPDGTEHPIFGTGGGDELAATAGVPLIGRIPIENAVAEGGDTGRPIALGEGAAAEAFRAIADALIEEIVPPSELAGCSARMLAAIDAAFADRDAAGT